MTKTPSHTRCWADLVMNFEHSDFDIVSDFGFRYLDFHKNCVVSLRFQIAKIAYKSFETLH